MSLPTIRAAALAASFATAALVQGCAVGPDAPEKGPSAPARFAELAGPATPTATAGVSSAEPAADFAFWRELKDPVLTEVVERALKGSFDVARATARIRESRAIAGASSAALLPTLDAAGSYTRQRLSVESPQLARIGVGSFPSFDPDADDFRGSLQMAYELDVWGKNRRAREAALADVRAEVERRRSIGLTLAGDVTTTYVDLRTLERRREVALRSLAARETALGLVRDRERAGLATDLDVARSEAERANAAATVPELDRLIALAQHRLAILAGAPPGALRETLARGTAKLAPFVVPVGVPAQLIARRPDLREASERLAAATARIGEAKAQLFPTISIQGEIGFDALDAAKFASSGAAFWSTGPSVRIPLFDAGRRLNGWTAAEERAEQALHVLEQQLLVALGEVEDALANLREDGRRRDALAGAVAASRRASDIAELRFKSGLVGYLDVIEAQRTQFLAEDSLADAEGRLARDAVQLAKAVAGGYAEAEKLLPPVDDKEGKS